MNRRQALATAGVAVAATAAGLGWSLRRPRGHDLGLWDRRFPTPDGGELALAGLRGQHLLLNFWATWCAPCVREMPALDAFHREHVGRGWSVVGLAVDQLEPVQAFLRCSPVAFPVALAGFEGVELSRRLGNDGGALPFTALFDAGGQLAQVHKGETRPELLAQWARRMD